MQTKPHILVNSLQRSGGTLVGRLLDGHPALRSMPFEMLYAAQKVRFPTPAELAGLSQGWDGLKETLAYAKNFERIARRKALSKDQYSRTPFEFDYADFEAAARRRFEAVEGDIDYAAAVSLSLDAFFEAWLGEEGPESGRHVNHLSMMCFASPKRYFELFPGGKVIQSLRDPFSWYASMKGHFQIADLDHTYMVYALEVWIESVIRGIAAARFWPESYAVVRYGDLVEDCASTMHSLAGFLGIEFSEELINPTLGGRVWLGNSSFGPKWGVDAKSQKRWAERLTAEEIEFIRAQTGAVGELVAEARDLSAGNLPRSILHPTSRIEEPLEAASAEELLANESRRMSLLTHKVFTQTVQRAAGARYQHGSRQIGLVERVRRAAVRRLPGALMQRLR